MEVLTYLIFGALCAAVAYVVGRDAGEKQGRDACEHLGELAEIFRRRADTMQEQADWLLDEAGVLDQMTGVACEQEGGVND